MEGCYMLLEELLFCTIFLGLPIVGMVGMIIARVLRAGVKSVGKASNKQEKVFRKKEKAVSILSFVNPRVMEYQLIENQVHTPLMLNRMKKGTHQRAGPIE